jgi:hypothetical protein
VIVSTLRNLIFGELPKNWDFDRKLAAADRILEPLERHIAQICKEHTELDVTIDKLFTEIQALRETRKEAS